MYRLILTPLNKLSTADPRTSPEGEPAVVAAPLKLQVDPHAAG